MFEDDAVEAPTWPLETLDIELIDEFEGNPNTMDDATFSALVEEIAESGWLVPIQVAGPEDNGRYRLIGGHHRIKAAKVLGYDKVPAIVVDPVVFDTDRQEIQVVKQNILHGELNPEKFTKLFDQISAKYGAELTKQMMSFTSSDAFRKVYKEAKKGLPPELAAKLEETREELKTVDQLSFVLNKLFTDYGDTLSSNFMVFVHGGRSHLFVQLDQPDSFKKMKAFLEWCHENKLLADSEILARMQWPEGLFAGKKSKKVDQSAEP